MARRPDYGIDSPGIVIGLLIAGALALACGWAFPRFRWLEILAGAYLLFGAAGMLIYSKSGKMGIRDRILGSIPWRGDELVLDAGCGRGLILIGAARRLKTGRAVGIDIWLPGAITGNRPQAVMENVELEGVSDRVDLTAGDVRRLPFRDNAFDAVVSNYVIHEVQLAEERQQLMAELVRVLKPGGHIAVVDFIFTKDCVEAFQRGGIPNARRDRISPLNFWVGVIMSLGSTQTYLVTGCKNNP